MMEENTKLLKCKNKTDEVLKLMGDRLGFLSIEGGCKWIPLAPPSLESHFATAIQELGALKSTLYEITIFNIVFFSKLWTKFYSLLYYYLACPHRAQSFRSLVMKRALSWTTSCATARTTSAVPKSITARCCSNDWGVGPLAMTFSIHKKHFFNTIADLYSLN